MTTKICTHCGDTKKVSDFYTSKGKPTSQCKECIKGKAKHYRDNNKEKVAACKKRIYEEKKEDILQRQANWRDNNRDHISDYNKSYKEENKELCSLLKRVSLAKRRALLKNAYISWADDGLMKDMYIEARHFQMEVDHIVPLISRFRNFQVACGLHWEGNLQLLSSAENRSKNSFLWPGMWDYNEYRKENLEFFNQSKG